MLDNLPDEISIDEGKPESEFTDMQKIISEFELRMIGYEWNKNGTKMVYTGNCLAGEETIQKLITSLHPFAKKILLISKKTNDGWLRQLYMNVRLAINLLKIGADTEARNNQTIFMAYFQNMINFGGIICEKNSQDYLKSFHRLDKELLFKTTAGEIF